MLHFPLPNVPKTPEREPASIEKRDAVYRAMLQLLPLSAEHQQNLLHRGLSELKIRGNSYRTLGRREKDCATALPRSFPPVSTSTEYPDFIFGTALGGSVRTAVC